MELQNKKSRAVKRRATPILLRFDGHLNGQDLPSDDSSDDEFSAETQARKRKLAKDKSGGESAETANLPVVDKGKDDSKNDCYSLPPEILLKIFQYAINSNPNRLLLLLRLSRVCSLWREVSADPSLWLSLDLSFGWIKSAKKALLYLIEGDRLSNLQHLCVAGCDEVDPGFIQIVSEKFPLLKSFDISKCNNIRSSGIELISKSLLELTSFSAANLQSKTLSVSVMIVLDALKDKLVSVDLSSLGWVTCASLNALTCLKQLSTLNIAHFDIPSSTSFIWILRQLSKTLQILRISSVRFQIKPDDDLETPIDFPELIELSAAGLHCDGQGFTLKLLIGLSSKSSYLDVRGWRAPMIDSFSEETLNLTNLQCLNLSNTSFSSRTRVQLAQCKSLTELDISRINGLSDEGYDLLFTSVAQPGSTLKMLYCNEMPITDDHVRNILRHCAYLELFSLESCRRIKRGCKRLYKTSDEIEELKTSIC